MVEELKGILRKAGILFKKGRMLFFKRARAFYLKITGIF